MGLAYSSRVKRNADARVGDRALLSDPQTRGGLRVLCAADCLADVLAVPADAAVRMWAD